MRYLAFTFIVLFSVQALGKNPPTPGSSHRVEKTGVKSIDDAIDASVAAGRAAMAGMPTQTTTVPTGATSGSTATSATDLYSAATTAATTTQAAQAGATAGAAQAKIDARRQVIVTWNTQTVGARADACIQFCEDAMNVIKLGGSTNAPFSDLASCYQYCVACAAYNINPITGQRADGSTASGSSISPELLQLLAKVPE